MVKPPKKTTILKGALYTIAFLLTVAIVIAAFISPAGAWPLGAAAITCVVIANLDRIREVSLSPSGVRALLTEAQGTVDQLKRIARLSAAAGLSLVQQAGRMGGYDDKEKEAFLQQTVAILQDTNMSDAEIRQIVDHNWDRYVMFDYVLAITGGHIIPKLEDPSLEEEWRALRNFERIPTTGELETFLRKCDALHGLRQDLLDEYRFYREHRYHRNLEVWQRRPACRAPPSLRAPVRGRDMKSQPPDDETEALSVTALIIPNVPL